MQGTLLGKDTESFEAGYIMQFANCPQLSMVKRSCKVISRLKSLAYCLMYVHVCVDKVDS